MTSRKQSKSKTFPLTSKRFEKVLKEFKNRIERVDGVPVLKRHFNALLDQSTMNTRSGVQETLPYVERDAFGALTYVKSSAQPKVEVVKKRFKLLSIVASDEYLQELCHGAHNNKSAKDVTLDVYEPLFQMTRSSIEKYSRPGKKKPTTTK